MQKPDLPPVRARRDQAPIVRVRPLSDQLQRLAKSVPARPTKRQQLVDEVGYSPYNLVGVEIGGVQSHARPIAYSGDIVNSDDMTDAKGNLVKPITVAVTCPQCGTGLELPVSLPQPPFPVVRARCPNCTELARASLVLIDPVVDGGVKIDELLGITQPIEVSVPQQVQFPKADRAKRKPQRKKKAKRTERRVNKPNQVEPDAIGGDENFPDDLGVME
jgi:hypothetical protein